VEKDAPKAEKVIGHPDDLRLKTKERNG